MKPGFPPGSIVVDGPRRSSAGRRRCGSCGRFVGFGVEVWGESRPVGVCNVQCGVDLIAKAEKKAGK